MSELQESRELLESVDARGVAVLTLNRPERHNAFNDALIAQLTDALRRFDARRDIRVVVVTGEGRSFCAGGDIDWMKRMAESSSADNVADALSLAELLRTLDGMSKPTIALVRGAVYGGGVGLVACCDIVIATDSARFCLSEVKLGLIPAVIGPFVVRSIGPRQARRLFLTAEEITAREALQIGLVHLVVDERTLRIEHDRVVDALLRGAPEAQREVKALAALYERRGVDDELMAEAARRLAQRRASPEAREGLRAFLEKRLPAWRAGEGERNAAKAPDR